MSCEKCNNKHGFAFGTCVECGWNSSEKAYTYIKVATEHLQRLRVDPSVILTLTDIHDSNMQVRGTLSRENEERLKVFSRGWSDTHVQNLTTRDRDENVIAPTCAHCGRLEADCKGTR